MFPYFTFFSQEKSKDITNTALEKMKELNDNFILLYDMCPDININTDDIKSINNKNIKRFFSDTDPYGEENWEE